MAETSRSRVTITLGRSGQVVKRAGPALDTSFPDSKTPVANKRSVRDRLGSNVDTIPLSNKRKRGDSRLDTWGVDGMGLGTDDLRFKIMQKTIRQSQGNGQQNGVDLRNMLSRLPRPSTATQSTQRCIPEDEVSRLPMPAPKVQRQHLVEPKDVRHFVPDPNRASILEKVPSVRTAGSLSRMDSLRTRSPWTLDRSRQRSPDEFLGSSRYRSPPRTDEGYRRSMIGTYDDTRTTTYMGRDIFELSKPTSSASVMTKPAMRAIPPKPAKSFLATTLPPCSIEQKSLYTVEEPTVDNFLQSLGLEKYAIHFKAEEVDMSAALRQMGEGDLKELGIPMGPRKKILLSLISRSKRQV